MGGDGRDRVEDVRRVLAAYMPAYRVDAVVALGAGLDHTVFEVNRELIVRFREARDAGERARRVTDEARLLGVVAEISPIPVPQPVFTAPELGCLAYVTLAGVPLLDVPRPRRSAWATSTARAIGELLTAMHAVPVDRMAAVVEIDDAPLAEWLGEATSMYRQVVGELAATYRPRIEAFLGTPPPQESFARVFSHNDLGIEHVLVDPATPTVTGVIDWSDAAITDPAQDFGRLYRDLGPAALDVATGGYRTEVNDVGAIRERAVFYGRCTVLEDLAYGLEAERSEYVEKSLDALEWLFPH